MPAEGPPGAGFTSPSGMATLVHPLALGPCASRAWEGSSPPNSQELAKEPLFGGEGCRKEFCLPSATGRLPWGPILEGAQPHSNQWPPGRTGSPVWTRPLSPTRHHIYLFHPFRRLTSCSGPGLICDIPTENRFDRQRRFFFRSHFLPNCTSLWTGPKLEISTIYSELRF